MGLLRTTSRLRLAALGLFSLLALHGLNVVPVGSAALGLPGRHDAAITGSPAAWSCACVPHDEPLTYTIGLRASATTSRQGIADLVRQYGLRLRVAEARRIIADVPPERYADLRADPRIDGMSEVFRDSYHVSFTDAALAGTTVERVSADLAQRYGLGSVSLLLDPVFTADIPPDRYPAVRADPRVRDIHPESRYRFEDDNPEQRVCPAASAGTQALAAQAAARAASSIPPPGRWSTSNLSALRSRIAAVAVGTQALFVSDYAPDARDRPNLVDIFDGPTGAWSTAALSEARDGFAVGVVGSKALFAGGWSANGGSAPASARVDIYDSIRGEWSISNLWAPRRDATAVAVGSKLLLAGGSRFVPGGLSDVVDIYDSATGEWTVGQLSQRSRYLTATAVGTKALLASLARPELASPGPITVDIYDAATGEWSSYILPIGGVRSSLVAATVGTKALFVREVPDGCRSARVVDIFDAATDQWSSVTLADRLGPSGSGSQSVATVGSKALFPGRALADHNVPIVDIYDVATSEWSIAPLSPRQDPEVALRVGSLVLFAGGSDADRLGAPVLDVYDNASGQWRSGRLPTARSFIAAAVVGNQALFTMVHGRSEGESTVDIYTVPNQ